MSHALDPDYSSDLNCFFIGENNAEWNRVELLPNPHCQYVFLCDPYADDNNGRFDNQNSYNFN